MIVKAKWKPLELSPPEKIMNQRQFHIPGGTEDMSATLKGLKYAGMVVPTTSPFNFPIWPVRKTRGPWRLTIERIIMC